MKITGVSSTADADQFEVGTVLDNAFAYLTLSVPGEPDTRVVAADGFNQLLGRPFASTGDLVFAMNPPHAADPQSWSEAEGLLRIDFARGTDFVQIDMGADDDDVGQLRAYDANDQLIGTVQVGSSEFRAQYASPSISFEDARISYVTVGGIQSEGMRLDNLRFGVVGTSTSDTIKGTSLADHYNGLGGNDIISGLAGDDTLIGGAGSDTIYGGAGADNIDLAAGGAQGTDKVVLQSRADAGDHVTGFDVGTDHDYLVLSDSFNKARKATDLDDEHNDGQLQFVQGSNGIQDDSGVVVDLTNATTSNADAFEAIIFSLFPEGVGSTVPFGNDPTTLAAFADEFSEELRIFSDRGDDLLIVSNAVFGSSPDQFAAFLYVEATGANGSDPEISGNELTLLATFESTGDVTPDHFLLG